MSAAVGRVQTAAERISARYPSDRFVFDLAFRQGLQEDPPVVLGIDAGVENHHDPGVRLAADQTRNICWFADE